MRKTARGSPAGKEGTQGGTKRHCAGLLGREGLGTRAHDEMIRSLWRGIRGSLLHKDQRGRRLGVVRGR